MAAYDLTVSQARRCQVSGQHSMNYYTETLESVRQPVRIKLSHNLMSLLADLLPLLDFVSAVAAGYLSTYVYAHILAHASYGPGFWNQYQRDALIAAVLAPFLLRDGRYQTALGYGHMKSLVRSLGPRFLRFSGVVLALGFVGRSLDDLPRSAVVLWLAMTFALTLGWRAALTFHLAMLQRRGIVSEAIAVVGAGPVADRLVRYLQQTRAGGVELLGIFDEAGAQYEGTSLRPTGSISDLLELGKRRPIDRVLVTWPSTSEDRLLSLVHQLKSLAVSVGLCPQNIGLLVPCGSIDYVCDGLPVTLLADRPLRRWSVVVKNAEDFLLGTAITVLALPVLAIIAVAIKLDSPGPVIYRQRRHTSNNVEFEVFKFRTMRVDPSAAYSELKQTQRDDCRITRIGHFLRKSSLDELPQLFNVLRGEMSLVGPRPHAVDMRTEQRLCHEIIASYPHRHRVKPGMTGWSQVNGLRGATETVDQLRRRVEMDLYYVEHWAPAFDLWILMLTFWVVVRGTNAR